MSNKDENYQRLPSTVSIVSDIQKEYKNTKPLVKTGYRAGMRHNRPAHIKGEIGFSGGPRATQTTSRTGESFPQDGWRGLDRVVQQEKQEEGKGYCSGEGEGDRGSGKPTRGGWSGDADLPPWMEKEGK